MKERASNQQKFVLKKFFQVVWNIVFLLLLVSILGASILFNSSNRPDKSFFGYRIYNVLTDSMRQTKETQKGNFKRGDMILVKMVNSTTIHEGDIVTFLPSADAETQLTHRIVKRIEPELPETVPHFVTRGDANNLDDAEISGDQIIGKVVFVIPLAGGVIEFIRSNLLLTVVFAVTAIVLFRLIKGYIQS